MDRALDIELGILALWTLVPCWPYEPWYLDPRNLGISTPSWSYEPWYLRPILAPWTLVFGPSVGPMNLRIWTSIGHEPFYLGPMLATGPLVPCGPQEPWYLNTMNLGIWAPWYLDPMNLSIWTKHLSQNLGIYTICWPKEHWAHVGPMNLDILTP